MEVVTAYLHACREILTLQESGFNQNYACFKYTNREM